MGVHSPLQPIDLLDLLVISFFVHRILVLFRGTTALQILVGLVTLRLLLAFARSGGLAITGGFLEAVNAVAVLVLVVVFRHEIREVLLQSSPVRLLLGRPEKARAVDLGAVAESAFRLAATRTGALLVFPNRDRLGEHVREGVALNGRFSPAVLEALFQKESPVHDGAAVIRAGRIDRIGTFLPLTTRGGLPAEYGTRHRAAIGLSESCDAVVVVVSEERGEVSVAQRGAIVRVESPGELEAMLRRRLLGRVEGQPARGWTAELAGQAGGFLAVFLILSASLACWRWYGGQQVSMRVVTVPLNFRGIPEGLELASTTAEQVAVHVEGRSGPLFNALAPEQVTVTIDLGDARPGRHRVVLGAPNVNLPAGLEVGDIAPATVSLVLERRVEKSLRVEPTFTNRPDAPFEVTARPATVTVSGPESELSGLDRIGTEPIDLGDLGRDGRSTKAAEAALVPAPASLRIEGDPPGKVRVEVRLKPGRP